MRQITDVLIQSQQVVNSSQIREESSNLLIEELLILNDQLNQVNNLSLFVLSRAH